MTLSFWVHVKLLYRIVSYRIVSWHRDCCIVIVVIVSFSRFSFLAIVCWWLKTYKKPVYRCVDVFVITLLRWLSVLCGPCRRRLSLHADSSLLQSVVRRWWFPLSLATSSGWLRLPPVSVGDAARVRRTPLTDPSRPGIHTVTDVIQRKRFFLLSRDVDFVPWEHT